jgi:hypothetical protein
MLFPSITKRIAVPTNSLSINPIAGPVCRPDVVAMSEFRCAVMPPLFTVNR